MSKPSKNTMQEQALRLRAAPKPEWKWPGLTITIEWRLRMSGGGVWAATVGENRLTSSGRPGKPVDVLTLVADDIPELLRDVSDLLDPAGPEIGPDDG